MVRKRIEHVLVTLAALGAVAACEQREDENEGGMFEQALSGRLPPPAPAPAPAPEPKPAASAEPPKPIEAPKWVDDYANTLCKRGAVCREKMLGAVPAQQKTMLAMQIPTQEACLKNTTTFKEKAPKAQLDASEKKALKSCLTNVPKMACGHVQTGKIPECETIAALIAAAKGAPDQPEGTTP